MFNYLELLRIYGLLWHLGVVLIALASAVVPSQAQNGAAIADLPPEQVVLRFATTDDFPPFNAVDDQGVLVGFNIDLARAICVELDKTCEIRSLQWDELFPSLKRGDADAIIASHRVNLETLGEADFTRPYFRTPGRFAVRRDGSSLEVTPEGLDRRRIAVAKGTAHEAFLNTFFRTSRIIRYDTAEAAREALRNGDVDTLFDDGISVVFWINGSLSQSCCDLAGGPFLEPMFFGDGIAIAVAKGNRELRIEINQAIDRLRRNGRMQEFVQRYFPRRIF